MCIRDSHWGSGLAARAINGFVYIICIAEAVHTGLGDRGHDLACKLRIRRIYVLQRVPIVLLVVAFTVPKGHNCSHAFIAWSRPCLSFKPYEVLV